MEKYFDFFPNQVVELSLLHYLCTFLEIKTVNLSYLASVCIQFSLKRPSAWCVQDDACEHI